MNRAEFMKRLRELLSDMEESERVEALSYYEEYFDDAGAENEQDLIKSLGSPEKVAKSIRDGIEDSDGKEGEKKEVGMHQKKKQTWILLILAFFALPILAPICFGVISAMIGISLAAAGIVCAVAILGIALVIAGLVVFFSAFPGMFLSPAVGVLLLGLGFVLIGIGILLTILGIWIAGKIFPQIIRWIVGIIQKIFSGKGR